MNHRMTINFENELCKTQYFQKVESALSEKLGLSSIRAGNQIIRNEKGWRDNERFIKYAYLIQVSKSFAGCCWIFSIKFEENTFRENRNADELFQGIFTMDENDAIHDFYLEHRNFGFEDEIKELGLANLFNVNSGITLDGISYDYLIFIQNATFVVNLNNPNSKGWQEWEKSVWRLGIELSPKVDSQEIKDIFT